MSEIKKSIVADRGSSISNSSNDSSSTIATTTINKIRKESAIISFIVGVVTSIVSSYVYDHFIK